MSKDARLSIRITPELDEWLGAESALIGLDKAAFARMVLFERMNGRGPAEAPMLNPAAFADPVPSYRPQLVTAPQPQRYAEGETGIIAHRRGAMPAYGNSSPRIQRLAVGPAAA